MLGQHYEHVHISNATNVISKVGKSCPTNVGSCRKRPNNITNICWVKCWPKHEANKCWCKKCRLSPQTTQLLSHHLLGEMLGNMFLFSKLIKFHPTKCWPNTANDSTFDQHWKPINVGANVETNVGTFATHLMSNLIINLQLIFTRISFSIVSGLILLYIMVWFIGQFKKNSTSDYNSMTVQLRVTFMSSSECSESLIDCSAIKNLIALRELIKVALNCNMSYYYIIMVCLFVQFLRKIALVII